MHFDGLTGDEIRPNRPSDWGILDTRFEDRVGNAVISDADMESVVKANEEAAKLVAELRNVACSKNALLAALGVDVLKVAAV